MQRPWIVKKAANVTVGLYRRLSSAEHSFRKYFPEIDTIEGFLRSPMQERWLFKAALAVPAGGNIVEIGSYKGRSTACLGLGCRGSDKKVWAIDLFEGDGVDYGSGSFLSEFRKSMRRLGVGDLVKPIQGRSAVVGENWSRPIHMLFIDGSHQYEDVLTDFSTFFPFVVEGGIVAFHDVGPEEPGVVRVWQETASPRLKRVGKCRSLAFGRKPGRGNGFAPFVEAAIYRWAVD